MFVYSANMKSKLTLFILVLFSYTTTTVIGARKGHNKIEAMSNPKWDGWAEAYKPIIRFDQGCYAYPAADKYGNYNGGLRASGTPGGGCRTARFLQVYSRKLWRINRRVRVAIMYAYFFPKDQGDRYGRAAAAHTHVCGKIGGHRYDWEEVIVFIGRNNKPIGAAASFHGKYKTVHYTGYDKIYWSGLRVKVKYGIKTAGSPKNNAMHFTTNGSTARLKMLDWYYMSDAMKSQINSNVWGCKTSPKISDDNFESRVKKALRDLDANPKFTRKGPHSAYCARKGSGKRFTALCAGYN